MLAKCGFVTEIESPAVGRVAGACRDPKLTHTNQYASDSACRKNLSRGRTPRTRILLQQSGFMLVST